ncbi:hypothetical protein [Pseudomonas sp. 4810-S13]|uniref:hypothetical protein n=1 Tax=Pseudomonas sp. 4810-S13 TaxID=3120822 RepID=UPI0031B6B147
MQVALRHLSQPPYSTLTLNFFQNPLLFEILLPEPNCPSGNTVFLTTPANWHALINHRKRHTGFLRYTPVEFCITDSGIWGCLVNAADLVKTEKVSLAR